MGCPARYQKMPLSRRRAAGRRSVYLARDLSSMMSPLDKFLVRKTNRAKTRNTCLPLPTALLETGVVFHIEMLQARRRGGIPYTGAKRSASEENKARSGKRTQLAELPPTAGSTTVHVPWPSEQRRHQFAPCEKSSIFVVSMAVEY